MIFPFRLSLICLFIGFFLNCSVSSCFFLKKIRFSEDSFFAGSPFHRSPFSQDSLFVEFAYSQVLLFHRLLFFVRKMFHVKHFALDQITRN